MEVTYIGHACFVIRFSTGLSVCFDPYSKGSVPGLSDCNAVADEVFCSHTHGDHNDSASVGSPDEAYSGPAPVVEIIESYHDEVQGAKRGKNNITIIKCGGKTAVHMGDIGCELSDSQIEKLKGCDLLMIPVGGFFTINCKEAFELCGKIDPKVVVPMHFSGESFGYDQISGREEFVELIENAGGRAVINGGSSVSALPEEKSLLLLDPLRIL